MLQTLHEHRRLSTGDRQSHSQAGNSRRRVVVAFTQHEHTAHHRRTLQDRVSDTVAAEFNQFEAKVAKGCKGTVFTVFFSFFYVFLPIW